MPVFVAPPDDPEKRFNEAQKECMYRAIQENIHPVKITIEVCKLGSNKQQREVTLDEIADFMDRNRINGLIKEVNTIASQTRENISMNCK
jgi:hypothetical protein